MTAEPDSQRALIPRRKGVTVPGEPVAQPVSLAHETSRQGRGPRVLPRRRAACPGPHRPVAGQEGGPRGPLFRAHVADHRAPGQPARTNEVSREPVLPRVEGPQEAWPAGCLVAACRALRIEEVGEHDKVRDLRSLDPVVQARYGRALGGGA